MGEAGIARRPAAAAGAVFLAVTCLLLFFHAGRLIFSPDEGILLEAAQRMLGGKKLYIDFFGYMSPGSYWLQELVFRFAGLSLRAARLIVILDFALQCSLIFWLVSRFGYRGTAWAVTALFFLFEASNPNLILPGHRWDSAALSLLAVTLGLEGAWTGKRAYWIAAGALAAFASICTPSIGVLGLITGLALLMPPWRRFFPPFALAAIVTAALTVLVMASGGYLRAFVAQMQWLSKNYSGVNVTGYGEVNGGYPALLQSLAEVWLPFRVVLLLSITLAALLPVVAILGWGVAWVVRKGKAFPEAGRLAIPYLLACLAGYVASTYPRPNLGHLMVVAPLGYVLVTILIARYFAAARLTIFVLLIPCALLPAVHGVGAIAAEVPVRTPVGEVRVAVEDRASLQNLLAQIQPHQTLYVHPYLPLFYFLTQTVNPTRFSYLAPGMMTAQEEAETLRELAKSPPDWVLYLPLRREDYLRIFPSATTYRFEGIEAWLQANYAPPARPVSVSGYQLLAPRGRESARLPK
jgi:hypothetical protein